MEREFNFKLHEFQIIGVICLSGEKGQVKCPEKGGKIIIYCAQSIYSDIQLRATQHINIK